MTPNISIGGYAVSVGGSGSGPYTVNYTMTGSESMPLPVVATFTDYSGTNACFFSILYGSGFLVLSLLIFYNKMRIKK